MGEAGISGLRRQRRRRRDLPKARSLRLSLLLASLISLSGCAQGGEGFWPSIQPRPRGSAAVAPPRPFLSPLPENLWELLGGLGLLASGGGVALFLWKFPDLLDEFSSLRETADRLHERRDRSTADLAQISRRITELEQHVIQLRRAARSRVYPPAIPRTPVALSQRFDPQESASRTEPAAVEPAPEPPPQQASVVPAEVTAGAMPEPTLDLASDDLVAAGGAVLAMEQPLELPAPPAPPTLETLIAAMNGESAGPIEGVTCVEIDIAPPPSESDGPAAPPLTRLRLVSGGGRFLLVLLDGDPWLFPTLDTLANFRIEQPDEGIFHYLPDSCSSPRLIRPAMLRDVGGMWEVSDSGQILVPTA
jgi:hypothetical protein